MPVAIRPRMTLDPVRLPNFRMRSGMIGLASLDSSTKNPVNRASERAPKSSVWAEPQPSVAAVTMA